MNDEQRGRRINEAQTSNQEADFEMWRIDEDRQRHLWFMDVEEHTDLENFGSPANTEPAELSSVACWKEYLGKVMQMPLQAHQYVAILRDRAEARLAQALARESRDPPGEGKVFVRDIRKATQTWTGLWQRRGIICGTDSIPWKTFPSHIHRTMPRSGRHTCARSTHRPFLSTRLCWKRGAGRCGGWQWLLGHRVTPNPSLTLPQGYLSAF